ncbi:MAG: DUF4878 domain-containing protein [Bacteroidales bacterium]
MKTQSNFKIRSLSSSTQFVYSKYLHAKKNFLSLGLLTLLALCICSCSKKNTAGEAAEKYVNCMAQGDYECFANGIAGFINAEDPEKAEEDKEELIAFLREKEDKELKTKGGIKKVELVSETIAKNKKTANVVIRQTYGNGTSEEQNYPMVIEDGLWKMSMEK